MVYVISYIKQGLGNKIFMLLRSIHIFKLLKKNRPTYWKKLFIVHERSPHEKGLDSEKLNNIFPKLKELEWLEFIDWKRYDSLKAGVPILRDIENYKTDGPLSLEVNYDFQSSDITNEMTFVKKYFIFNEIYEPLLKKYDTKKGILIHYRIGDKFEINYKMLKSQGKQRYVLLKPEYYIHNCMKFLENKKGPVYLVSDSPEVAECLLKSIPNLITVREDANETFFLMTKFKRIIISESTMSISAGYMNKNADIVSYKYYRHLTTGQLITNPYVDAEYFEIDPNSGYMLKNLDDYKKVIRDCHR
jgi:hypothetical protein